MPNRIITDISDYIFVSGEPQKVDAIFLPGGSHPEQPEYAAELYRQGLTDWIVPSGGVSVKEENGTASAQKRKFIVAIIGQTASFYRCTRKNGVPQTAIIEESKSGHTRDNAFLSRKAVDEKGIMIKSGIIVCKAFHARRCLMLYQMAFPNVDMTVCPVHCYNITKENWYTTEKEPIECSVSLHGAEISLSAISRLILI